MLNIFISIISLLLIFSNNSLVNDVFHLLRIKNFTAEAEKLLDV